MLYPNIQPPFRNAKESPQLSQSSSFGGIFDNRKGVLYLVSASSAFECAMGTGLILGLPRF